MKEYTGYVGAPYNFIEMNQKVNVKKDLQPHDVIEPEKHSGVIEYEIEAKTPIMVDDGKEQFYQNVYGKAAIPGSTMRGLVRNNMQILSFSSIATDIQNGKLMYRNVAAGKDKKKYNDILGNQVKPYTTADGKRGQMSVLMNVQAGYIRNEGKKYYIIPTVVEAVNKDAGAMNYYVLNERKIIENNDRNFSFLLNKKPCIMQNQKGKFRRIVKNGRVHYIGNENKDQYHPYTIPISYKLSGLRQVSGIAKWGELENNGYLVSTGRMQEKKAIYVIPQMDESKSKIEIPSKDIDDFKRDYESRRKQVESMEEKGKEGFFNLPENGETKPVFYIHLNGKLYFGFTPRLRLFYDKEIFDGVYDSHLRAECDYCRTVFGFAGDKESYRSRVAFMDACIINGEKSRIETQVILGSPKPTSYLDYLTSTDGKAVTYNDDFTIQGVKQYWLKRETDPSGSIANMKTAPTLRPYEAGTKFKGKIRFENLSDEELGMLLWSLLLEKNSNQNIGKAKAYGYGRVAIKLTGLNLLDYNKMYGTDKLSLKPYCEAAEDVADYINKAKQDMTKFLGHDVMEDPRIIHFLMMKDVTRMPDKDKVRYMTLQGREYQNRVKDLVKLQTVQEVIEGKPVTYEEKEKPNKNRSSGGFSKNNNSNHSRGHYTNNGKNRR